MPAHSDPARKLMGDPPPGMSALDRRAMRMELNGPVVPFAVDWSKIRVVVVSRMEHKGQAGYGDAPETDETGTPLEGDTDWCDLS